MRAVVVVVLFALLAVLAEARPRREFGSATAPVRLFTATGTQPADSGDCFVGSCPQDVTMPFVFGDVCDNTVAALSKGTPIVFDSTVGTSTLNLAALFYEFFINQNCPTSFSSIFGAQWETYTDSMNTPVEFNFIETGVKPNGPHNACPRTPSTVCGAFPSGKVRMNFIFESFCGSTCIVDPSATPSTTPSVGPSIAVSQVIPPSSNPPISSIPQSANPTVPPASASNTPKPTGGLGPIPQPGGQVTASPFVINFPNPPPIVFGTKDVVGSGVMARASFVLSLLGVALCALVL